MLCFFGYGHRCLIYPKLYGIFSFWLLENIQVVVTWKCLQLRISIMNVISIKKYFKNNNKYKYIFSRWLILLTVLKEMLLMFLNFKILLWSTVIIIWQWALSSVCLLQSISRFNKVFWLNCLWSRAGFDSTHC